MTLGKRLELALEARGKSQQGFGKEHDFPTGAINRIVNGRRVDITPDTLMRLADGLDVSLVWMATGRGAMDTRLAAAIEFARLDGVPVAVIDRVADDAGREALHIEGPSQWLDKMKKARSEAVAKAAVDTATTRKAKAPKWSVVHPPIDPGLFHLRLASIRVMRKLTIEELARETARLGSRVTPATIRVLESGKHVGKSTSESVASIARALAVDPAWLGMPADAPAVSAEEPAPVAQPAKKARSRKSSAA